MDKENSDSEAADMVATEDNEELAEAESDEVTQLDEDISVEDAREESTNTYNLHGSKQAGHACMTTDSQVQSMTPWTEQGITTSGHDLSRGHNSYKWLTTRKNRPTYVLPKRP